MPLCFDPYSCSVLGIEALYKEDTLCEEALCEEALCEKALNEQDLCDEALCEEALCEDRLCEEASKDSLNENRSEKVFSHSHPVQKSHKKLLLETQDPWVIEETHRNQHFG